MRLDHKLSRRDRVEFPGFANDFSRVAYTDEDHKPTSNHETKDGSNHLLERADLLTKFLDFGFA